MGYSSPPRPLLRRQFSSRKFPRNVTLSIHSRHPPADGQSQNASSRRVLLTPLLALDASILQSAASKAADINRPPDYSFSRPTQSPSVEAEKKAGEISSRIYDSTAIGSLWEKLMNARIVYLGEAEQVPVKDDEELELEINLRKRCVENEKSISLAMEANPCDLQPQLNQYMDRSIDGETFKSYLSYWPPQRWQEYEPLLSCCRDNGVRIVACGTPLKALYVPPPGSGFISGFTSISLRLIAMNSPNHSVPYGPSSYLPAQSKVVEDYTMSQIILQAMFDGGAKDMLVLVTGASHFMHGSKGTGLPARISKKIQKKNQLVILLDPERQFIRREGEVPVADFCDIQEGLNLDLVLPEVLQNFFNLEQYPLLKELGHSFEVCLLSGSEKLGFREKLLADPKFLHRLAIEEGNSGYFFTVWLPAPTLSFLSYADERNRPDNKEFLKGLLGSIPDNAFQKNLPGKDWNLSHRFASVLFGGLKLSCGGFISGVGAVAASSILHAIRKLINLALVTNQRTKRSPILKTAVVYGCFLGTSANLRYQIIAGIVEHRISDAFASQTLLVDMLSFVVRTINSYWGTQQWVDLARYSGLHGKNGKSSSYHTPGSATEAIVGCNSSQDASINEIKNQ
ncbi:hypothetical protein P3X46_034653 [Hevea brasiliensis]|uniref:Haem-binding uptake Tiki superfamily ChaN domain-containing protein n=1 Tax=Hevea brasiliensis TaxID=3981 RepID=A0ABQ9K8S5_HEVBR|nr:hypothetical protein P3X46_034653 [Hevea brasiliensis]